HSPKGQALTMRGVQMRRPSLYELVEDMKRISVPALIVTGDEDDPCLEPALLMKRNIPNSGLVVLPRAGHTINIEDPEPFNRALFEFFALVDEGRAAPRNSRKAPSTRSQIFACSASPACRHDSALWAASAMALAPCAAKAGERASKRRWYSFPGSSRKNPG